MTNPFIPAYRIGDGATMGFRCPSCGGINAHGFIPGDRIHGRGSHCVDWKPCCRGYWLIVVGWVRSSDKLPKLSLADVLEFNLAISALKERPEQYRTESAKPPTLHSEGKQ